MHPRITCGAVTGIAAVAIVACSGAILPIGDAGVAIDNVAIYQ